MKTKLNITIEEQLLYDIKSYAAKKKTSVSKLIETYFKTVLRPSGQENIIDLVESLEKPDIEETLDIKELYYQSQKGKYGF